MIDKLAEGNALEGVRIGFALTGSHCTLGRAVREMIRLRDMGGQITPIISYSVKESDTKFGTAAGWREQIMAASGSHYIIDSIVAAEPVGPKALLDILVIAPCSGNTLAKLAMGATDSPALMAAKAHLRNLRPVVVAVSTNDGLGANFKNIGLLFNTKNIFFVPFYQDNPELKPNSLLAYMEKIPETVLYAKEGKQIQPVLLQFEK